MSLLSSPVLLETPVMSSMARFISAQTGIERTQISRSFSVILLPLVKPPLIFTLLINTCSKTRSAVPPIFVHFFILRGIHQLVSGTQQDAHSLYGPWTAGTTKKCKGCDKKLPYREAFQQQPQDAVPSVQYVLL